MTELKQHQDYMKKVFENTSVEVATRSEIIPTVYATEKALQEIEMNSWRQCSHCLDTGIRHIPNGQDDFDEVYCNCPKGRKLEQGVDCKMSQDKKAFETHGEQMKTLIDLIK